MLTKEVQIWAVDLRRMVGEPNSSSRLADLQARLRHLSRGSWRSMAT
jgi:hypothetical protein